MNDLMRGKSLVISPHVDDAFLSLGGLLTNTGVKKVIDVFPISKFHRFDKSLREQGITGIRRAEELLNSRITGVEVEFLPFAEGRMRGYKHWHTTPLWPSEARMISRVKGIIRNEMADFDNVFFPLGTGHHVDHLLVASIGFGFVTEGKEANLYFYEDMPYTVHRDMCEFVYMNPETDAKSLAARLLQFDPKKKLRVCSTYRSQVDSRDIRAILRYAKKLANDGKYYERVFRIADP